MKKLLTFFALLMPLSTFALDLITDFEWLEPDNRVEVVIGEPYQLKFTCSDNSLAFTSAYADSWVHVDFDGGQHVVETPTGYSINERGVITGLVAGSYAIHPTGWVQRKSGAEKWLYITVVSERSETESNNTLDTANNITSRIRFGLYNISDIDYFSYTNSNLNWGDNVTFKIHYYGSRENPFGYKWATFCGGDMVGGGSLISQDQECKALVTSSNTVHLEVYYDQSRSEYFNYGEEFVAEVYINGVPASEIGGNDDKESFEGEGTEDSPYIIKTADNLTKLSNLVNTGNSYSGTYFILSDNIDMTGVTFNPIGNQDYPFSGYFDGEGFVIKGLSIDASSYIGLFGYTDGATINNVGIEEADLRGWNYIGGVVGYCFNTIITNCFTRGTTLGNDCVGALVGYSGEGTIVQNCFSSVQHTKYEIYGSVGGLVGYNCGILENSYYYGTINAKIFEKSTTGGIVGYNHTTGAIHNCYFIKYGDIMNGEFNYCGSLNWGDCYGTDSFDLYGITTSGSYLHEKLNSWVKDHSYQGHYRKWTNESFPSFAEYAEREEQSDESNEYVDLALPSGNLWAKTNIGAKHEYDYGDKYAFGEIMTKEKYMEDSYAWLNYNTNEYTKYVSTGNYADYKTILDPEDDIVTHLLGEGFRIPSQSDYQELCNYCSSSWVEVNGVYGRRFTGANGNTIFLPASGYTYWYNQYINELGYYMTSNVESDERVWLFYFSSSEISTYWRNVKYQGYSVRGISSNKESGVKDIIMDHSTVESFYDLKGTKIVSPSKGLNIIKSKDGKTKKIIVK